MTTDGAPVAGSLLAVMGERERSRMLEHGVRRAFATGDVLHREGDPASHVHFLMSGWTRVSRVGNDGQVVLLALRGPGDVVGELAALNGWARMATVQAIEPVEVLQLTGEQFVSVLLSEPTAALAVARNLSDRLRDAHSARVDMATLDVGRRLAGYLHRLGLEHGVRHAGGVTVIVPLSQQDIADGVGASRRAVTRALLVLRDRGIVTTSRRQIVIRRPDVLSALAGVRGS